MGEVWRARDTSHHDRLVALKLLPPGYADDRDFQARFRREARLAAALRSPHVVPIHQYGEIEGRLYLDMQLVSGADLSTVLAEHGPMTARRVVGIVAQLAAVLDLAHREGLIHRDIKPSNVRLLDDDFVYLLDFGLATRPDASAATSKSGYAAGTLHYMAPERFGGERVDHRADIYSLACLFYVCLTGRPPFDTNGLPDALQAHLSWPPPRPCVERPDVPPGFDAVVATGMAKKPELRYPSAGHLAAAARDALSGVEPGGHQRRLLGGAVALAAVAAATAVAVVMSTNEGPAPVSPPASSTVAVPAPTPAVLPPLPAGTVRNMPVGKEPFGLAVAPDGRRVYVADEDGGTVTVVDAVTDSRVTTIQVAGSPLGHRGRPGRRRGLGRGAAGPTGDRPGDESDPPDRAARRKGLLSRDVAGRPVRLHRLGTGRTRRRGRHAHRHGDPADPGHRAEVRRTVPGRDHPRRHRP
jgi:serine/threonine-protein kinase